MPHVAVCRWPGSSGLRATFIRVRDGSYLMCALGPGYRLETGTEFVAAPDEIVEWVGGSPPPEVA